MFSEIYGRGDARSWELTDAVRASAAFPPVMPPMHFAIHEPRFTAWATERFPRTIVLSDGGVWNNLGTDWSRLRRVLVAAEVNWWKSAHSTTEEEASRKAQAECPPAKVLLVANASKPEKLSWSQAVLHKFPGFSSAAAVVRAVNVAVNSTVAGRSADVERTVRRRILKDQDRRQIGREPRDSERIVYEDSEGTLLPLVVFVEMTRRPGETAKAYNEVEGMTESQRKVIDAASESEQAVEALKPLIQGEDTVPTTFDNLGRDRTLRLIVLGYLNTRETLAVVFANHTPPAIPGREWFEALLPRHVG